ncbi:MAG TPA: hypothetical protein VIK72_16970 [Clostridiaceae bacterium]
MDVFEIVSEIKQLLNLFPKLDRIQIGRLRLLSSNLSGECGNIIYDMIKEDE